MSIQFEDLALPGIATSRNANLRTATRCPHLDSRTPTESPPPLSPSLEYCSVFPCSSHDNCRRIGVQEKKKKVVFNKSSGSATLRFALGVSGHKQCRHFFEAKLDKWSVGSKPTLCLEGHGFKYLRGYRPFCHHGLTQTFQTGVAIVPRIRPRALPRPSEYITD